MNLEDAIDAVVSEIEGLRDGEWRRKAKHRFRHSALVAVCYKARCREVFDYHEAICDLIDDANDNSVSVSVLTLAQTIHDHPPLLDDEALAAWLANRLPAFEAMRDEGLLLFHGTPDLYRNLEISLPDRTYSRWHRRRGAYAKSAPRDPQTGRILPAKAINRNKGQLGSIDGQCPPIDGQTPSIQTETKTKTVVESSNELLSGSPTEKDLIEEVFTHWVTVDNRDLSKLKGKAKQERYARIRSRLREGLSVADLKTAIDYYCNDPWHLGENPRKERYTDLQSVLKDNAKVQRAVERTAANSAKGNTDRFEAWMAQQTGGSLT